MRWSCPPGGEVHCRAAHRAAPQAEMSTLCYFI